jgi:hypothetical protein
LFATISDIDVHFTASVDEYCKGILQSIFNKCESEYDKRLKIKHGVTREARVNLVRLNLIKQEPVDK